MRWELLVMAFVGGAIGAIMNTTPCFVTYGVAGVVRVALSACRFNSPFYDDIVNIVLIPGICMSGAVASTAFAANRRGHLISGSNCQRSLWFTNDPLVYLTGGSFGVMGYLLISTFTYMRLPVDTGALALVLLSFAARTAISKSSLLSCKSAHVRYLSRYLLKNWTNEVIPPAVLSALTAMVVHATGSVFICFWASAATLLFVQIDPNFPATHHITLVSAYAAASFSTLSAGLPMAVVAGIGSQLVFEATSMLANYGRFYENMEPYPTDKNRSHFDPPAMAIAVLSACIFTLQLVF